jgi:hypothetical protein
MSNLQKTVFAAVITACLTLLTAMAVMSYINPPGNDIAHNQEMSVQQANAQSVVDDPATSDSAASDADASDTPEAGPPVAPERQPVGLQPGVPVMSEAVADATCQTYQGATSSTITDRDTFVPVERIFENIRESDASLDVKKMLVAMTISVYDNPRGYTENELLRESYKFCMWHYGYPQ